MQAEQGGENAVQDAPLKFLTSLPQQLRRLDGNLHASGEREPAADPVSQDILQRVAVQCRHEIAVRVSKH